MGIHERTVASDPRADVAGYLARLGLEPPARPDVEYLFALHRAHKERVSYENLEIQLGRSTTVDPVEAIGRIARGRGGYCFHLNGALGTLLACLGYEVTRHRGQVRGAHDKDADELAVNHQVLVVRCEAEPWFVDCGLGDEPYEPMPLREGKATQGPFTDRLEPWTRRPGGWRFVRDERLGGAQSMVFEPEPVRVEAFAASHKRLSTFPDSPFVLNSVAARRDATGIDALRGRVLSRIDVDGESKRTIGSSAEWFGLLADVFRLDFSDVDGNARARLWSRVCAAHERWLAEQDAAQLNA